MGEEWKRIDGGKYKIVLGGWNLVKNIKNMDTGRGVKYSFLSYECKY